MRRTSLIIAALLLCAGTLLAQPAADARAPIDGVTLKQWARASGRLISGVPEARVLADLGLTAARWEKVNERWGERLAHHIELGQEYADAFNAAMRDEAVAAGEPGAREDAAPIPFEKWIDVQEAMSAATYRVQALYGLEAEDWLRVQGWWNGKLREKEVDKATHERLSLEYQKRFADAGPAGLRSLIRPVPLQPSGDPVPLERWVEMRSAADAAMTFTLKRNGLTQGQWIRAITWWGGKMNTGNVKMEEWVRLSALSKEKYAKQEPW